MMLVCAEPPTRDTDRPGSTGGRIPELNKSDSMKICPSVIEITLVGTKADTSPAWVSMIGKAVNEPVLPFTPDKRSTSSALIREERSNKRECK